MSADKLEPVAAIVHDGTNQYLVYAKNIPVHLRLDTYLYGATQLEALRAENERLKKLVDLFKRKRMFDGLNGRGWDARIHLEAETAIAELLTPTQQDNKV